MLDVRIKFKYAIVAGLLVFFCGTAQAAENFVLSDDAVNNSDAFDAIVNRYYDILNRDETPAQLPPRESADGQGAAVEVEDPKSAELERKLEQIDSVPPPRPIDKEAIQMVKEYESAKKVPKPLMENGRINFYYGTMNPRVLCRPLRLTDIELEPGEQVTNVHISDSVRWSVSGSWSGAGANLVTHVILKPQLPDISANLLIHTDRRTYSISLVSTAEEQFMPYVGFVYPEMSDQARSGDAESWKNLSEQYKAAEDKRLRASAENARLVDPARIYVDYTVKVTGNNKNIPWKPLSAYDANGKTYIVMPPEMSVTEAPALFIKQGSQDKLVNYRVEGNLYIVDRLFDVGVMVVGKDRVAIIRKNPVGA